METRHPVGGHLAVSFRLLYTLRSYDGLKWQDVDFLHFLHCLEKNDPT